MISAGMIYASLRKDVAIIICRLTFRFLPPGLRSPCKISSSCLICRLRFCRNLAFSRFWVILSWTIFLLIDCSRSCFASNSGDSRSRAKLASYSARVHGLKKLRRGALFSFSAMRIIDSTGAFVRFGSCVCIAKSLTRKLSVCCMVL